MKVVYIEWEDSFGGGNWMTKKQANLPVAKCVTVGFVVKETKRKIVISSHECDNGDVHGSMAIPKSCIKSIKELKV